MTYNIKNIREQFKAQGVFYTPEELALMVKSYVKIDPIEVYDPTCGDGALLAVWADDVKKYGQEINEQQLQVAQNRLKNFTGFCGDTLKTPAFEGEKFECIVANPPFSISWQPPQTGGLFMDARFSNSPTLPPKSKADFAFLLHILHYLSDTGVAVVLGFPGMLYRGNAEGKIRKWIVQNNWIEKVVRIPAKQFVDTPIETCLIVLRKNKQKTDIEFVDTELELSRIVAFEEIEKMDFTLSVSAYVQKEEVKEQIDSLALANAARKATLQRLKAELQFEKTVCQFEGLDFQKCLDEFQKVIDSFRG